MTGQTYTLHYIHSNEIIFCSQNKLKRLKRLENESRILYKYGVVTSAVTLEMYKQKHL